MTARADVGIISILVDGRPIPAIDGMTLTAVLVRADMWRTRVHLVTGEARGPFCGMGICFECELSVDGRAGMRACLVRVAHGMQVTTDG